MEIHKRYNHYRYENFHLGLIGELDVEVEFASVEGDFILHSHDFFELFIVTKGTGVHQIGEHRYDLSVGNYCVVKNGIKHGFFNCEGLEVLNVGYRPEIFSALSEQILLIGDFDLLFQIEPEVRQGIMLPLETELDPETIYMLSSICKNIEALANDRKNEWAIKMLFFSIVTILSTKHSVVAQKNPFAIIAHKATSYIIKNYHHDIGIGELAAHVGVSTRHLERSFKKIYLDTPASFLKQYRMKAALKLLTEANKNVNDVAAMCGYSDPNYFSKTFKSVYGICPSKIKVNIYYSR